MWDVLLVAVDAAFVVLALLAAFVWHRSLEDWRGRGVTVSHWLSTAALAGALAGGLCFLALGLLSLWPQWASPVSMLLTLAGLALGAVLAAVGFIGVASQIRGGCPEAFRRRTDEPPALDAKDHLRVARLRRKANAVAATAVVIVLCFLPLATYALYRAGWPGDTVWLGFLFLAPALSLTGACFAGLLNRRAQRIVDLARQVHKRRTGD